MAGQIATFENHSRWLIRVYLRSSAAKLFLAHLNSKNAATGGTSRR
jgi:hypothetical protein